MEQTSPYAIELLHISKSFDGYLANDDVTLCLRKGEIHALLGENGAGKSTLMRVLFGLVRPDKGQIKKNGTPIEVRSPNEATAYGIGMVHQHFKLVGIYSVLDNIILGNESTRHGFLVKAEARRKVTELSKKYGLAVDPDARVDDISVGMQQRTEILKMLYRDNEILIFDEPTAVLTVQEVNELMHTMKQLAAEGCSILFITHHLDEIMAVADRCTILSKGKCVGTVNVAETTKEELSRMMVGREVKLTVEKKPACPGREILRAEGLCVKAERGKGLKNVGFCVHGGEIVCVAGIDGNGQAELVGAVTGMLPVKSGKLIFNGQDITNASVRKRSVSGISHIPEDRLKHGLIKEFSVENNLILQRYFDPAFTAGGQFLRKKNITRFAESLVKQYDIRLPGNTQTPAGKLSGGNQQKVIIARELEKDPRLVVAVQPVRGLDVGAIEAIHNQLIAKRDEGCAVLLVSLELEEVMNLADRILVLFQGELVGELDPTKTTAEELGLYMAGGKKSIGEVQA